MSVVGCVVAVTAALGADAFPDGSTATIVKECVVAAASRSTVTARSPVHWRLSAVTRTPFAKMRYLQQVESSSATGSHARPTVDEVVDRVDRGCDRGESQGEGTPWEAGQL